MGQSSVKVRPKRGRRDIPFDSGMDLVSMLNTGFVTALLEEINEDVSIRIDDCQIGHIRYRPRESCSVNYRVKFINRASGTICETHVHALVMTEERYLSEEKRLSTIEPKPGSLLNGINRLERTRTLLFEFPNDSRLPHLEILNSGERLPEIIASAMKDIIPDNWRPLSRKPDIEILRYKPESRLVCRYQNYWEAKGDATLQSFSVILRFERAARVANVLTRTRRLAAALAEKDLVGAARILFTVPEYGLIGIEQLGGEKLSKLIRSSEGFKAAERTGVALAVLHDCPVYQEDEAILNSRMRDVEASIDLLKGSSESISGFVLDIASRLSRLKAEVSPGVRGLVHGDFHQGQMLFDEDISWFIDVDCSGVGDTAADLGNFIAQLRVLGLKGKLYNSVALEDGFVSAYQEKTGREVDRRLMAGWIVHGLLELAAKDFRRLKPGWPESVKMLLAECQRTLNEVE